MRGCRVQLHYKSFNVWRSFGLANSGYNECLEYLYHFVGLSYLGLRVTGGILISLEFAFITEIFLEIFKYLIIQ